MSHNKYKLSPVEIKILKPLVEFELYQSSVYTQLANLSNKRGFLKAETYFLHEAVEEREHAMKHYNYITGRGGDFEMPAIDEPSVQDSKSLYEIVEQVLAMENEAAKLYETACKKAMEESQMLYNFLLPFLTIQFEAYKFNIDACAMLEGLDKSGELVAESKIYG